MVNQVDGGTESTNVTFTLTDNYQQFSLFHDVVEASTDVYVRFEIGDELGDHYIDNIVTSIEASPTLSVIDTLLNTNSRLRAYPNPTNGLFTVEGRATPNTLLQLEVVDPLGRTIWIGNMMSDGNGAVLQTIDISRFSAGMYYLKCINGEEVKTISIIKAK